jgi:hypothetical protein
MKSTTKKTAYKIKKALLVKSVNINSFEKKPINGGTPAIENSNIVIEIRKKLLKLKLLNDCSVLNCVSTVLKSTQKRVISEVL